MGALSCEIISINVFELFQVDTNVGRICVRLGWVPLEPLPEELQLHLLELYFPTLNDQKLTSVLFP